MSWHLTYLIFIVYSSNREWFSGSKWEIFLINILVLVVLFTVQSVRRLADCDVIETLLLTDNKRFLKSIPSAQSLRQLFSDGPDEEITFEDIII